MNKGYIVLAAGLAGCATVPAVPTARPAAVPAGMQYLYGSGEAAALSRQAYTTLVDQVRRRLAAGRRGAQPRLSVVLAPGSTLAEPRFVACGDRPPAAVFDIDETVLLNLGYEEDAARRGSGYDPARWARWERSGAGAVSAVPGAAAALADLRALGVTVVFNSNRGAASAAETRRALAAAGLGDATPGETLYLQGADGATKDRRREAIAARYCVIAMGGDQLGDFSDLFVGTPPARRAAVVAPAIAGLWGRGWFVLPNPVYGSGLAGGPDDVFPADKHWQDPAGPNGR